MHNAKGTRKESSFQKHKDRNYLNGTVQDENTIVTQNRENNLDE